MADSSTVELRLPDEWAPEFNDIVVDPDGWRSGVPGYPGAKRWDVPISRDEYQARLGACTVRRRN